MNIHPIFVHFPIALFSLYTALEILQMFPRIKWNWLFPTKAILLLTGTLGVFIAQTTGEIAESAYIGTGKMQILSVHSGFAVATTTVFSILTIIYLIEWIQREKVSIGFPTFLRKIGIIPMRIHRSIWRSYFLVIASLIGLILVTITGALGGALVYGSDVDPIVSFIVHLIIR